ncbi:fibrobacter succinogenes major paralogous domain-containing protein [Fibrobacter sp.]
MALKKFLMVAVVAALFVACGDDDSSFATRPSDGSSSSVTPQNVTLSEVEGSSDSETSVSSSSTKPSSSSVESSSSDGYVEPSTVVKGTMTDERDGQTYKTVTIGTQTWMAENLNYAYTDVPYNYTLNDSSYTSDSTSWCYKDSVEYCAKYGRLYTWAAAMDSVGEWSANGKGCGNGNKCSPTYPVRGICPEGWHLPTQTEWDTLITAVGGRSAVPEIRNTTGKKLKSTSGWYYSDGENGTDDYSFTALPAGFGGFIVSYCNGGTYAYFWSSTEYGDLYAYIMELSHDSDKARLASHDKFFGYSVRCVQDSE